MNTSPFVSIIVAVYNAEKYLNRCVDSLVNQTLKDIEILLINDGSTDNSGAICNEYAAKDSRIKVFHRTNHGVAATRQFGLEHCTGEYVIHCDPDDWVDLDMYEKMYNVAKQEQADMVICDYVEEYKDKSKKVPQRPKSLQAEQVLKNMYEYLYGSCWNKLTKTETIKKYHLNFIPGCNICEDRLFNTRLLQHPINVAYCPNTYYHYDQIINSNSYLRTFSKQAIDYRVNIIKKLREYQTSDSITDGIYNMEISTAFLSLRHKLYTKAEFENTFKQLKETNILTKKYINLQIRVFVWTAVKISYNMAYNLMTCKLWYRKYIKGINE